jgi:serine/threonine protein kinase
MFKPDVEESALHSMAGSVIGTPLFMSPEQARGENDTLDGRADIYALGIILFVMLVRKNPYNVSHGDRWGVIREAATGRPRRPSELRPGFDPDLERIIMKALATKRDDRYATAGEFGAAIRSMLKEKRRAKRDGEESSA